MITLGSKKSFSKGFTIVELMIALSIFATILAIGTALMVQIGALYNKGVNQANLQNATRNLLSDISTTLQYSGNGPSAVASATFSGTTVEAICIDNVRYSFVRGRMLGNDPDATPSNTPHVLWRDTMSSPSGCTPLDLTQANMSLAADAADPDPVANGYEMLPERTRVTQLQITQLSGGTYRIEVALAYGDSVQFSNAAGRCVGERNTTQFCAVSRQTTSVIRRIE